MNLKLATYEDWKILLPWHNDPESLASATNPHPVTEIFFQDWMKKITSNPDYALYLAYENDKPVGNILIQLMAGTYYLSWLIAPEERKKGYGKKMVLITKQKLDSMYKSKWTMECEIKPDNIASQKIAKAAGMTIVPHDTRGGMLHYSNYR